MISPNRVYFGLFLAVFVAIGILIILFQSEKNPYDKIQSFNDCVKAGYPIMQSYPPQCTLPNGRFFVSPTITEKQLKR
jgi:hypothetical protein